MMLVTMRHAANSDGGNGGRPEVITERAKVRSTAMRHRKFMDNDDDSHQAIWEQTIQWEPRLRLH
jgi:hypothetical protein